MIYGIDIYSRLCITRIDGDRNPVYLYPLYKSSTVRKSGIVAQASQIEDDKNHCGTGRIFERGTKLMQVQ